MGQSRPDRPDERFVIPSDRSVVVPICSTDNIIMYCFGNQLSFLYRFLEADDEYGAEECFCFGIL